MKYDQIRFIFQHSPPCSPLTSSDGVTALGFYLTKKSIAVDMTLSFTFEPMNFWPTLLLRQEKCITPTKLKRKKN